MRSFIITSFLLILTFSVSAQTFANKDFYLIDSIDLETVSDYDKEVLQKYLTAYHEAKSDTAALAQLGQLIENCFDEGIWPRYNLYVREKSHELRENEKDSALIKKYLYYEASSYGNEGYLHSENGDYNKEEKAYLKALELFKLADSNEGIAQIYNFLGTVADAQGDLIKGLDYMQKGLELAIKVNDVKGMAGAYANIAASHLTIHNYELARFNYQQAISNAQKCNDVLVEENARAGLAYVLYGEGKLDSALIEAERAMDLVRQDGSVEKGRAIFIYKVLGKVYLEKNQPDSAIVYFKQMIANSIGNGNNINTGNGYEGIGKAYLQKADYDSSLYWGRKCYSLGKEINYPFSVSAGASILMASYKKLNQPDSALKYAEIHYNGTIDRLSEENTKNLFQQSEKYKFDEQKKIDDLKFEQEIALERAARQRNATIMYSALVIILLLVGGAFFIFRQLKTIKSQQVELSSAYAQLEESKKNELIASNLKALQSQMNPHFIFNALNSVQDLVLLQDIRNSNKFLGKFSDLIRKILLSSQKQFITLNEEIETLQLYLDLETLRFGKDFHSEITQNLSAINVDEQLVPAMFIQPFAENAMKHGLFHKKGEKRLSIAFSEDDKHLICTITDNGIGTEAAAKIRERQTSLHTGFSTEAIKNRIDLLNQKLEQPIELVQTDLQEEGKVVGHQVIVRFPKNLS